MQPRVLGKGKHFFFMTLRKAKWILIAYVLFDVLIGYAGIFPLGLTAAAQFTTVSGTVVDPNGLPYANGTIVAVLVTSASPTLNGLAYTPPTQPVGLNLAGSFVMQLADNNVLLPAATKWNFTVCSAIGTIQPAGGKGPICFSLAAPITITGASQSISANLNAVAPALSAITGGSSLTINPSNGVIPVRSNATTFIDSPLSVSGGNVANTGVYTGPVGSCANPTFSPASGQGTMSFGANLLGLCASGSNTDAWIVDASGHAFRGTAANLQSLGTSGVGVLNVFANRFRADSATAPTCAFTSGGGTGPSCAVDTGSSDSMGSFTGTAGTTPGASGSFTLTLTGSLSANAVTCTMMLSNAGTGTWNARGTLIGGALAVNNAVVNWDNNGTNLTAASTYKVMYWCTGRG